MSLTKVLAEGGLSEGAFSVGEVVFGLSSPRKASWISHIWCFDWSYKSNCIRITENSCLLRDYRINNSNNNRPFFDTLKTGGCKPAKAVRGGLGSTEPGVCSLVLGTYPQRGSAPPGHTSLPPPPPPPHPPPPPPTPHACH